MPRQTGHVSSALRDRWSTGALLPCITGRNGRRASNNARKSRSTGVSFGRGSSSTSAPAAAAAAAAAEALEAEEAAGAAAAAGIPSVSSNAAADTRPGGGCCMATVVWSDLAAAGEQRELKKEPKPSSAARERGTSAQTDEAEAPAMHTRAPLLSACVCPSSLPLLCWEPRLCLGATTDSHRAAAAAAGGGRSRRQGEEKGERRER
jgi:hypothetical protein